MLSALRACVKAVVHPLLATALLGCLGEAPDGAATVTPEHDGLGSAHESGTVAAGALDAAPPSPPPDPCRPLPAGLRALTTRAGTVHIATPEGATSCAPTYVALHGAGSSVLGVCARFAPLAELSPPGGSPAVLLCPTGNLPLDGDHADWTGDAEARAAHVDAALGEAREALGLDRSGPVALLAGFSRGGFLARDLAQLRPGRFERLLIVGAAFVPDAGRWREAGVLSAIFAATDSDGAATTMRSAATRTAAAGLPARFVSLGPGWHDLPEGSAAKLEPSVREALAPAS